MNNMDYQTPRGTRDFLPQDMAKRQFIVDTARKVFEQWGFDPLDTPAFEEFGLLTAKSGQAIKDEVYYFKDKSDRELGLRFDFTVPLARVVVNNPDIPKPFRRYQIGPVWRYDRPGASRYREFWQADVDIVGAAGTDADAEVVACACEVIRKIGLSNFRIRVNNRKLISSLLESMGEKSSDVLRIIDKLDKIGEDGVREEMKEKGVKKIDEILKLVKIRDAEKITPNDARGEEGLEEVRQLIEKVKALGFSAAFDMSLVRGLDYYTGNVFEICQEDGLTITAGGRYDNMIEQLGGKATPAVGISLGVDRLANLVQMDFGKTKVNVYVACVNEKAKIKCAEIVRQLRDLGINAEYDVMERSLGKQLQYVNAKGIKFSVVVGENEMKSGVVKIRNMESGNEREIELRNLQRIRDIIFS
jgi:histidyl-tRNA synthetase